ncbi:MAG: acyl-CoA dehydrogenase family protein, partial [Candidatus Thiodiazotropha sp. (ex Lucinoma borealis)]|nr:acyl-CoA dehydrogenase family protein [Candidatus Thiodiazotropha sp. (ex Lucinoma borealis)]
MYPRDLESILEQVQHVAKDVVAKNAADVDRQGCWPEEGLRALQQAGVAGLTVPMEYGGLGHGSFAVAQICELLGQECASTAMCFGMHCVG